MMTHDSCYWLGKANGKKGVKGVWMSVTVWMGPSRQRTGKMEGTNAKERTAYPTRRRRQMKEPGPCEPSHFGLAEQRPGFALFLYQPAAIE